MYTVYAYATDDGAIVFAVCEHFTLTLIPEQARRRQEWLLFGAYPAREEAESVRDREQARANALGWGC